MQQKRKPCIILIMHWLSILLLIYGGIVFAGGAYGYFAKGSLPSLLSAIVADVLLAFGVVLAEVTKQSNWGYGLGAFVALALGAFFAMRLAQGSLFPGLPMLILSVIALVCIIYWFLTSSLEIS